MFATAVVTLIKVQGVEVAVPVVLVLIVHQAGQTTTVVEQVVQG